MGYLFYSSCIFSNFDRTESKKEQNMEFIKYKNIDHEVSRIGLGTWAIGGWMWGGTNKKDSIKAIHAAFEKGINLIDTAPVYGFGKSEEIVGEAIREYRKRDEVILATKVALDWEKEGGQPFRNSSPERIMKEIDDSLRRLKTDYIDIYLVHWPDPEVPFEKTAQTLFRLKETGKIRSIGVSNFSPEQMEQFKAGAPLDVNEPPYNLFERGIENDTLPYCKENDIRTLGYGSLCRGLLSGKMARDRVFEGDDLRKNDPKFQGERYDQYLTAVSKLNEFAMERYNKKVIHLAERWMLDQGISTALWGARRPQQLDAISEIIGWKLMEEDKKEINCILEETIKDPVGPEFMAPPLHKKK